MTTNGIRGVGSLFLALLLLTSCGGSWSLTARGGSGQPCFTNHTCKDGLSCRNDVCTSPTESDGDSDTEEAADTRETEREPDLEPETAADGDSEIPEQDRDAADGDLAERENDTEADTESEPEPDIEYSNASLFGASFTPAVFATGDGKAYWLMLDWHSRVLIGGAPAPETRAR